MTDTMDIAQIHEDATAGAEIQEESADEEISRTLTVVPDEVSNEATIVPLIGGKKPRAKPAPKEYDADGNPVPKAKAPRKPAAPKTDEAGNPIAKTPRKPATPKLDKDGLPVPRKTPVKRTKLPSAPTPTAAADDPFVAAPGTPVPATPTMAVPTPKGARTPKRVNETVGDECGSPTPVKKAKTTATSAASAMGSDGLPALAPLDALVLALKTDNKSWAEIHTVYAAAGGTLKPDTLRKRYTKLAVDRVSFTNEEIDILMTAANTVAATIAEAKKALDKDKWTNIKKTMEDSLPSSNTKFSIAQLQKKVDELSATWVPLDQRHEENHSQASTLVVESADENGADAMDKDEAAA